VSVYIKRKN